MFLTIPSVFLIVFRVFLVMLSGFPVSILYVGVSLMRLWIRTDPVMSAGSPWVVAWADLGLTGRRGRGGRVWMNREQSDCQLSGGWQAGQPFLLSALTSRQWQNSPHTRNTGNYKDSVRLGTNQLTDVIIPVIRGCWITQ